MTTSTPPTVTLTLSREDAELVATALTVAEEECQIDEQDCGRLYDLVHDALDAPPVDSLERALSACEANGWNVQIRQSWTDPIWYAEIGFLRRWDRTPLAALRQAMAAAEHGESR